jgi:hypothetical protein
MRTNLLLMASYGEEIHSRDSSQLIPTRENELGFKDASFRGQGPCLYSPLGSATAVGSNRPWSTIIIHPQRQWKGDPRDWTWLVHVGGRVPTWTGWAPCLRGQPASGLVCCLLESSRVFLCVRSFSLCKSYMWAFFGHFLINPCKNRYSPKLMELCQCNPYS